MIAKPIGALVIGTQRIAAGQFETPVQISRRDELGTLADSFNKMSLGLKERDNLREQRVKSERDLALARKIQMDVLPKQLPVCPGYELATFAQPAEQTGGDIYDLVVASLDAQHHENAPVVMLLADATGHGIGPAISVTQVRSMLRIGVRLQADLDQILSQINRQLCHDLGCERFVTAFLGLLDPATNCISYHSAGQAPLLHFHANDQRLEWLEASMLPLGIDEEAQSDGIQRMQLATGDVIVLLTDGFYECRDPEDKMFGEQRVGEIVLENSDKTASELLKLIIDATTQFARGAPQADDMTAIIIRRVHATS